MAIETQIDHPLDEQGATSERSNEQKVTCVSEL